MAKKNEKEIKIESNNIDEVQIDEEAQINIESEEAQIDIENEDTLTEAQALAIKIQELEVLMEETENKAIAAPSDEEYQTLIDEHQKLKEERKLLRQQLKDLNKVAHGAWDKIPLWMYIYIIFVVILYSPFLSSMIWINFSNWLITIFNTSLNDIANNAPSFFYNIILVLLVYALPLLGIFLSWILYTYATKKGFTRKIFSYIWLGQGILMIGMGLWIYFNFLKDILQ